MNGFNRTALALYSLLWIAACAGAAALVWNQDQKLDLSLGSLNVQAFATSDDTDRWIITAILALLGALGLLTLLTAFRRGAQASAGFVRLSAADGGVVEVSATAIEALLRTELERVPGVRQVNPVVRAGSGSVRPDITASIDPGTSLVDAANAITDRTAAVLREQVGATRVRRPILHLTYDDLAARQGARLRPQAAVTPPEGDLPPPPPSPAAPPSAVPVTPPPPVAPGDPFPAPPPPARPAAATVITPAPQTEELPPVPPPAFPADEPGSTREAERGD